MNAHYIPERFSNGVVFDHLISDGNLLPDQEYQDPCELSTVQRFTIGTRLVIGERSFRYGKFHTAVGELRRALANGNIIPDDGAEVALYGSPAIGDRIVTVLDTGAPGDRPANYYQGGFVLFYRNLGIAQSALNHDEQRRIVSSTIGTTAKLSIELDYPLTCVPTQTADLYASPYSRIGTAKHFATGAETFVGFAHAFHAAGGFGWVQTWGPCHGTQDVKFLGERGTPGDRDAYFTDEGGVVTPKSATGTDNYISLQRAGYVIPCTKSAYGSMFFMLQLAP